MQCLAYTYAEKSLLVYLKLTFDWETYTLAGNPLLER